MKTIMIPTTNELYEIPNYEKYELPNKVVDYIKQLEEESKNNYFIHMKEWAKAIGNNAKLQQRIDKAIEYIKSDGGIKLFNSISSRQQWYNYLLSILEGKEVEDE